MIIRIKGKIRSLWNDKLARSFVKHNRRCFPDLIIDNGENTPEVLFEFNSMQSAHIAYSYLANVLAKKFKSRIVAYVVSPPSPFWRKLKWKISQYLSLSDFSIYRSFGSSNFVYPNISSIQRDRAKQLFNEIIDEIKNKKDIESICIDGTWFGDLIYDSYLRSYNKPTIDIKSKEFKDFLHKIVGLYVFWNDYFNSHDVRAVNVSHCVYINAIPLRIAVNKNIPAFQINATHAYRLSKENYFAYNDFFKFRDMFLLLPDNIRSTGLEQAKKRIDLRFSGEVGVDMAYSKKSAYGEHKEDRLLKDTTRVKVLIATHCFFDSPHSYGNNLFPDFYEWLDFLGHMTMETDYDWYIKTHPDYLDGTMEVIEGFLERYPKFNLLPSDSSHHQIISEGISVALTTYGTIAFEYAALGVPVVNASLVNPHIAYNFNLNPKNIDEYRDILTNLEHMNFKIDKKEVYEYYFMKFIYNTDDWLFNNFKKTEEELGGYSEQFTSKVYNAWLQEWTPERHKKKMEILKSFTESNDFRLRTTQLDQDI